MIITKTHYAGQINRDFMSNDPVGQESPTPAIKHTKCDRSAGLLNLRRLLWPTTIGRVGHRLWWVDRIAGTTRVPTYYPIAVCLAVLLLAGSTAQAAKNPPKPVPKQEVKRRTSHTAISRVIEYSLPDEQNYIRNIDGGPGMLQRPLCGRQTSSSAPDTKVK